jgi:hypothetical protein
MNRRWAAAALPSVIRRATCEGLSGSDFVDLGVDAPDIDIRRTVEPAARIGSGVGISANAGGAVASREQDCPANSD